MDDKHVLIKAAFIEEVKDLLQEEVSRIKTGSPRYRAQTLRSAREEHICRRSKHVRTWRMDKGTTRCTSVGITVQMHRLYSGGQIASERSFFHHTTARSL